MWKFRLLFFVLVHFIAKSDGITKVTITKSGYCPEGPNPVPLPLELKVMEIYPNNTHSIFINATIPFAIHTNTIAKINFEMNRKNAWIPLVKLNDKRGVCELLKRQGGDFWQEIRAAIKVPDVCPIPKGNYFGTFAIDLMKFTVSTIPAGIYRVLLEIREKTTNRVLVCLIVQTRDE